MIFHDWTLYRKKAGPTFLEYIESSWNQLVDTGFTFTDDMAIEMIFSIPNFQTAGYLLGGEVFGSENGGAAVCFSNNDENVFVVTGGDDYIYFDTVIVQAQIYKITLEDNGDPQAPYNTKRVSLYMGDGSDPLEFQFATYTSPYNSVILFGVRYETSYAPGCMRLYSLKLSSAELGYSRTYLPCLDPDGTPCLYIEETGEYLYDFIGQTGFIAGPEL